MINYSKFLISVLLILIGCNNKSTVNLGTAQDDNYTKYKSEFNPSLVDHFPKKVLSNENYVISNTNEERNDVGLFLFEYKLTDNEISNLRKIYLKKSISNYTTNDSCLLKVNPFETQRTKDSLEVVEIDDNLLIDKPCYKRLSPIPNFIDYSIVNKTDFWADKGFEIYVLDAKSGNHFKQFDLQPNPQMPEEWKNGYSKGIAINKLKRTVIYWSVIW